jgi:hypothetical protein
LFLLGRRVTCDRPTVVGLLIGERRSVVVHSDFVSGRVRSGVLSVATTTAPEVTLWAAALQPRNPATPTTHDDSNSNSDLDLNLHTTFTALQSPTTYAQSIALRHSCEPHSWLRPQPPASASLVPAQRPACQQQQHQSSSSPKHELTSPPDNLTYTIPHDCIYTRQLS